MDRFKEYTDYDALGLAALVKSGDVPVEEIVRAAQARLADINPVLNAVICSVEEPVASHLDADGLFSGVPFLVKDLTLAVKGCRLSNGSAAMKNYVPRQDSVLVQKFKSAGLVILGKTNTSELGASSLTAPQAFGPTHNPWNIALNAGGSSGGSSAAVAARIVPMAYSSDGGGSIRLPASYCGIFGFKPSRNLNKYEDMSPSWGGAVVSHVSTISVRDSAAYLDLVSGRTEGGYRASQPGADTYLEATRRPPSRLRIGYIAQAPIDTPVHPECIKAATATARYCEDLGHHVEAAHWNFDGMALMRSFLTVVFHATHRNVQDMAKLLRQDANDLPVELSTRFMGKIGSGVSDRKIQQALDVWRKISVQLAKLHAKYDVILSPTVATPPLTDDALDPNPLERMLMRLLIATGLGKFIGHDGFLDSIIHKSLYHTPFTPIANATGQPAMSLPLYWDATGLPHGSQFMAQEGRDALLFSLAAQLETAYPWKGKIPPV